MKRGEYRARFFLGRRALAIYNGSYGVVRFFLQGFCSNYSALSKLKKLLCTIIVRVKSNVEKEKKLLVGFPEMSRLQN